MYSKPTLTTYYTRKTESSSAAGYICSYTPYYSLVVYAHRFLPVTWRSLSCCGLWSLVIRLLSSDLIIHGESGGESDGEICPRRNLGCDEVRLKMGSRCMEKFETYRVTKCREIGSFVLSRDEI